jgi:hypothetical protein
LSFQIDTLALEVGGWTWDSHPNPITDKLIEKIHDGIFISKECKTTECQNKWQKLQWKKQGDEYDHIKMKERV